MAKVRNAGEWWGWEGEHAAVCHPACSPARAPVTSGLRAGNKIIVLLLQHITTYYYIITISLIHHYFKITSPLLQHYYKLLPIHYYILHFDYFIITT
jgi:hypothetical protein